MRLRLFTPLRAKITSSAQSLVPPSGRPSQESSLPILTSFDHLVGALLEKPGYVEAERLRSLEVDRQCELDRALDGKVARLRPLEDTIGIGRRAPKIINLVISVGQQAAKFSPGTEWINGGKTVACGQRDDLRNMSFREGIRHHDQAAIRLACVYANDGCEFGRVTDGRRDRLHCERLCRGFEGLQPIFGIGRRCGVEQESDPGDARRNLL